MGSVEEYQVPDGPSNKAFGERLKGLLRQREMSQAELAKALGTSNSRVSGWCRGEYLPNDLAQEKIANVLRVPVWFLLSEENEDSTPSKPVLESAVVNLLESQRIFGQLESVIRRQAAELAELHEKERALASEVHRLKLELLEYRQEPLKKAIENELSRLENLTPEAQQKAAKEVAEKALQALRDAQQGRKAEG